MQKNIKSLFILAILLLVIVGVIIYFALQPATPGNGSSGGVSGSSDANGSLPDTSGGGGISPTPGSNPDATPLTEEEKKKLIQLSSEPVIGPAVKNKEEKVLYFKRGTGNLYENAFNGEGGEVRLSNFTIQNIIDAKWSSTKSYALITTLNNDAQKNFWLHLTSTSTIQTGAFTNIILSSSFSPSEDRLASLIQSGSSYSIVTSNPEGKSAKTLLSTSIPDFELSWVTSSLLALKTKTSAYAPSLLETVAALGGNPTVIHSGKTGFDTLWRPDGSSYIASHVGTNPRDFSLSEYNRGSENPKIDFSFKTLPEKCIFSKKEANILYCAVPKSLSNAALPDDWWQGKVLFTDELWKLNIQSGASTLVLENGDFDITNLTLSPGENYIFFINKKDSTLWSYRLL